MLYACEQSNSTVKECLYIGDAERDIQAGKQAGMLTMAATYGYILENDDVSQWGADAIIEQPEDIIQWLNNRQ